MKVAIDFTKTLGAIREMNGINDAPYQVERGSEQSLVYDTFTDLAIPYCRTHDVMYPWGSGHFIDIPCIFKDFEKDPYDEKNYDFHYSDEYIAAVIKTGCKIFYRLGSSIEHGTKKYNILPPADFKKWAVICEMIIRHYTEGWGGGHKYPIEYWEIWNEPENAPMWTGTKEQYFNLYEITSLHLKKCFPNLKIGGYASCGFYAVTQECDEFYENFVDYFLDFLEFVKEKSLPFDFFSWHIYSTCVEDIVCQARFVREKLDEFGFTKTESILNEWNYGPAGDRSTLIGASFVLSVMIALQSYTDVKSLMYYTFNMFMNYNGLTDFYTKKPFKTYYSFKAFSQIQKLGQQVSCDYPFDRTTNKFKPYIMAAKDEKTQAILISNYSPTENEVELALSGFISKEAEMFLLDENTNLTQIKRIKNTTSLKLKLTPYSILLIKSISDIIFQ